MAISLQQAQQAGTLASQILTLEAAIANVQAAIASDDTMTSMATGLANSGRLELDVALSPQSTTNILNAVLAEMNAALAGLQATFAALVGA